MLAVHDNVVEYEVAAPVPEREIFVGEFEALLVTVRPPVTPPVAAGANVTLTVTALEVDTGLTRSSVTPDDGSYTIPLLPPGQYRLAAEKAGR